MAEDVRDWGDALSHAQELLALEPLSEAAHRRVMRLHFLRGDRAAALLAFDRCEQVLKDDIGAAPSAETLVLLATIEQAKLAAVHGASAMQAGRVPAAILRPPRTIGRDAEAGRAAASGSAWVTAMLDATVPSKSCDSFLHRNPVNRELLALALALATRLAG